MRLIPILLLLFLACTAACSQLLDQDVGTSMGNPSTSTPSPSLEIYKVGSRPRAVAAADLDDDGYLDIVVANSGDDTLTVLLGTSNKAFRNTKSFMRKSLNGGYLEVALVITTNNKRVMIRVNNYVLSFARLTKKLSAV